MGTWGGSAGEETFWLDLDDDGLGSGDGYLLCNGLDLTGWVVNNDDEDDNCYSNYLDCIGVCDGEALLDNCDVCDNDPTNDCLFDCAGVPGGTAIIDACGVCSYGTTGHLPNSDIDDCGVCFGNNANMDCADICDGLAVIDNCGICDEDNSNNCEMDCAGNWGVML